MWGKAKVGFGSFHYRGKTSEGDWFHVGFSPRKPALGVALVLRFAPYMLVVFGQLREAWQARTGTRNSWRLLAPFAIQSLSMSDHVAEALKARGGSEGLSR